MTTHLILTSSDTFLENDARAVKRSSVEVTEYVEGTYDTLRSGPDGVEIARFVDGAWELPSGDRFSDWAVGVKES